MVSEFFPEWIYTKVNKTPSLFIFISNSFLAFTSWKYEQIAKRKIEYSVPQFFH